MKPPRLLLSTALIAAALVASPLHSTHADEPSSGAAKPVLVNTCLITARFRDLVEFYRRVLSTDAQISNGNYAEFPTGAGVLAIFAADAHEKYIPGSAEPAMNRSSILQFRVSNVDAEYARLQSIVKTWVKPPSNQPWGTRSFYFRDPDGNLVDFHAPLKPKQPD